MNLIDKLTQRSPRNARTAKDLRTYLSQRYDLPKLKLASLGSMQRSISFS